MNPKEINQKEFELALSSNFVFENNPHIGVGVSGGPDSMALVYLLNKWIKEKNLVILTAEDMMSIRDEFIEAHRKHIYEDTVTLCHTHHLKLHSIYGKKPSLNTGPKQQRWVNKRREKEYYVAT